MHAKNKFFRSEGEKEVLLQEIAELAEDFTGAELQNILYIMLCIDFVTQHQESRADFSETEWQE